MKAFSYLAFPNSVHSVFPKGSSSVQGEPIEHEIVTSVTNDIMSGNALLVLSYQKYIALCCGAYVIVKKHNVM